MIKFEKNGGGYTKNSNKGANTDINRPLTRENFLKYLKKQKTYDIIGSIRGAIDPDSREKKIWAHEIKNCVTVYFFSWTGGNSSFLFVFRRKTISEERKREWLWNVVEYI